MLSVYGTAVLYAAIFILCAVTGTVNLAVYGKQSWGFSAYIFFIAICALVLGIWTWKMRKKEKEDSPVQPRKKYGLETVKPPIRSANPDEALEEILRDLRKPLKLIDPKTGKELKPPEEKKRC